MNNKRIGLIGNSPAMQRVYEAIHKVAATDVSVAIYGESGTGKELVAQALHQQSPRVRNSWVDVNCAAIPKDLIESELFGHERGAFSGAVEAKPGRFELAQGGTLFLDEVGELPWELQAKLLRVLQERQIWRVGGRRSISVDIRIIVATHRNLETEVQKGNFREDLFYRLNVFPIWLPPLRERGHDIVSLAEHFLMQLAPEIPGLHPSTRTRLCAYPWPGNVRELRNCLQRAVIYHEGEQPLLPHTLSFGTEFIRRSALPQPLLSKQAAPYPTLDQKISETIREALQRNRFNKSKTARELGIQRKRLDRMIQRYDLNT